MSVKRRWSDLSPRARRALLVGAGAEAGLKAVALVDLARRPRDQVRGSKAVWAVALVLVNSAGVLPVYYLVRGRRA